MIEKLPNARPTYVLEPPEYGHVLYVPDSHHNDQDQRAWDAMVQYAKISFGSNLYAVVLLGDAVDGYAMSEYSKRASVADRLGGMKQEFQALRPNLEQLCSLCEIVVYIKGNHELRVDKTIENAGMYGLSDFNTLSGFDKFSNLDIVEHSGRVRIHKTIAEHGDCIRGGNSCEAISRNYPEQVSISGHTHRLGSAYHAGYGLDGTPRIRAAYKAGHLANQQPTSGYTYDPNWQQGFVSQFYWRRSSDKKLRFRTSIHPIINGEVL